MKVPLRFQNTEYDCGTTTFINALAYLFDREDIPVELLKAIYQYTLDVEKEIGVVGSGGTSNEAAEKLTQYFIDYAHNNDIGLKCEILKGEAVTLEKIKECLDNSGVVVARCYQLSEHYCLITKIDDIFAYIFDPYYLPKDYYVSDPEIAIVLDELFTHNRIVTLKRLFGEGREDFSLMEKDKRQCVLINHHQE